LRAPDILIRNAASVTEFSKGFSIEVSVGGKYLESREKLEERIEGINQYRFAYIT
jgi:hypothetical protein